MSVLDSDPKTLTFIIGDPGLDEAQVAAAAFLARYNGRTLDAYRYDFRTFFQWAADVGLPVMEAKRPHIELYRTAMEQKGLAPSTIDRRLSTVCGFYRFAHIDGRVSANPAQYVRRPKVHPSEGRGLDRRELGIFLFTAERFDKCHAALAVLLGLNGLRVTEAGGTNVEDLAFTQRHRTLRIMGKGSKPAVIPLVPRAARTIDLAIGQRTQGHLASEGRNETGSANGSPLGARHWPRGQASMPSTHPCSVRHSSWRPSMPGSPSATSRSMLAMRAPGRPRSMTKGGRTSTGMPPMSWLPSSPVDRRGAGWRESRLPESCP